ncbi:MAG: phage holin family protein [Saprospiraceae bacterium]|nr:phage holin family protein [Saprospiraceae bacterium]MDW8484470.1 phage holin family protein [Saprospiraceae bacterium]
MSERKRETEEILQSVGETVGHLREYVQLQLEYFRLDLAERFARALAGLALAIAVGILLIFSLFMATVALALFLGARWQSLPLGFLAVSGVYLLLTALVVVFKESLLINPLLSNLVKTFLQNTEQ